MCPSPIILADVGQCMQVRITQRLPNQSVHNVIYHNVLSDCKCKW